MYNFNLNELIPYYIIHAIKKYRHVKIMINNYFLDIIITC